MTIPTTDRTPADEQHLADVARALAHVGLSWSPAGRRPSALYWAMAEELAARGLLSPANPAADPDRPHVLDAVGRRVYSGDVVGATTSGRYQGTISGPVIQLGRGKVKIRVERGGGGFRPEPGDDKWISTSRIFLVSAAKPPVPATALTAHCGHGLAYAFLARSVNRRTVKHLANPDTPARKNAPTRHAPATRTGPPGEAPRGLGRRAGVRLVVPPPPRPSRVRPAHLPGLRPARLGPVRRSRRPPPGLRPHLRAHRGGAVSSTYTLLCLSHDPAVLVSDWGRSADNVIGQLSEGVEGHEGCDLVLGRVSGALVEVGCPPTRLQHPDNKTCHGHADTVWTHVDVLRLLAAAYGTYDDVVSKAATAPTFRHWPSPRLHRLRVDLGLPR
ncbi:hypothetical protein VSR01_16535 [Actinacidiphila sp. DG2A-62]|uniref:hypothetical protein n=1 Tax=Actinacidiphila sp. DG2A-62 TaxID=3108821 RepID=UPI002DBE3F7D|nr:hypothetical protein [Actinacidiphila sp. DG2A-62]MEC3995054.1 hypothetical protein [Actinacidiphila sp. DG2A-62]